MKRTDGSKIFVRDNAKVIKDEFNNFLYYEGTIEDITFKKRAEEELKLAKERAEMSDKLKTEFLAQMSHEIRTPINTVLSFVSLIQDDLYNSMTDDLKTSFEIINRASRRIIRTIDLLLNMSELQTGAYEYAAKKFDLHSNILEPVYFEFNQFAREKNIQLYLKKETDKTNIVADEYSVNQIFNNLIDNAIKYTSSGSVTIRVFRNSENKLTAEVIDTGIGISKEYLPNLFKAFTQEEQGYTRKFEGNGLGLALVKKYAEINNILVEVESEKGAGSTFRVIFNNPSDI